MRRRWAWTVLLLQLGCAGPGPVLFPAAPIETRDGGAQRFYDTDSDGRADFAMILGTDGRVDRLQYEIDDDALDTSDGSDVVLLDRMAPTDRRHLVIILDSVPYAMVNDLWRQGRFRLFHPPRRVISPFPVMTDLSLSELFGTSPSPGVESEYYDGHQLINGYFSYAGGRNTGWLRYVDYHLKPVAHSGAYTDPHVWFDHELRHIQDMFQRQSGNCFVGYCVGPSAVGAKFGRDGHQAGLIRMDRFCQQMFYATRGKIHITLLSDHGHNLMRSRRIPLSEFLRLSGYRVTNRLERPGDVVVPEFGIVTCAAIHTQEPAPVARDVLGLEGIDVVAYLDRGRGRPGSPDEDAKNGRPGSIGREGGGRTDSQDDRIIVLNRSGRAVITRSGTGYRYETLPLLPLPARERAGVRVSDISAGDPLDLGPVLKQLQAQGHVDADGFVDDRALFEATVDGAYPDAVHRLWRAFHGLVEHEPDVFITTKDGWHCGSPFMTDVLDLAAAHGNLGPLSTTGFVMSTAGAVEPVLRMEDLHDSLTKLGIPLPGGTEKK